MGYNGKGRKWNDEIVKDELMKVMTALGISRMPTSNECNLVYGSKALSQRITKRKGGWWGLAKEMNLDIKPSQTLTGKKGEEYAVRALQSRGFHVERMSQNFPYDILVDKSVKIDVITSALYKQSHGNFYSFNLEKKSATCDIYILLTLDDDKEVDRVYIVPSVKVIHNTKISIGEISSVYHQYIDKWDYIVSLSDYWKRI